MLLIKSAVTTLKLSGLTPYVLVVDIPSAPVEQSLSPATTIHLEIGTIKDHTLPLLVLALQPVLPMLAVVSHPVEQLFHVLVLLVPSVTLELAPPVLLLVPLVLAVLELILLALQSLSTAVTALQVSLV